MTFLNRVSSQVILAPPTGGATGPAYVAPPGQALFGTNVGAGTFTWTVPKGVTTISAVAIGGGGGGPFIWAYPGGCGGGLGWRNNIQVQPGGSVTVVVGAGGGHWSFGASNGGESYVVNTNVVRAGGGAAGDNGFAQYGTYTGDGGGNGGTTGFFASPGGGAGGYTGAGGNAGSPSFGFGGGGGCFYSSFAGSGSGGGTGLRGTQVPPDGFGSATVYFYSPYSGYTSYTGFGNGGGGGAGGGANGQLGQSPWTSFGPNGQYTVGGNYGGGAGGSGTHGFNGYTGGNGAQGGCRIIWGKGREFPGTLTDDIS